MRQSTSYVMTLDPLSAVDMEKLQTIKATIRAVNAYSKNKKRVVIRGRKPIVKMKTRGGFYCRGSVGPVSYDWAGNIVGGIANASKYDVYIYERR